MTPAVFWILAGLIASFLGAVIIFWATTRHDGVEPDSRPLTPKPPTYLEQSVMEFFGITFTRWLAMSPAEQSIHVERYFTHKGL